jgi:hypothetical protein
MVQNVLRKADRVHQDTVEQERIFKAASSVNPNSEAWGA